MKRPRAEQPIREAVVARKLSFGADPKEGEGKGGEWTRVSFPGVGMGSEFLAYKRAIAFRFEEAVESSGMDSTSQDANVAEVWRFLGDRSDVVIKRPEIYQWLDERSTLFRRIKVNQVGKNLCLLVGARKVAGRKITPPGA